MRPSATIARVEFIEFRRRESMNPVGALLQIPPDPRGGMIAARASRCVLIAAFTRNNSRLRPESRRRRLRLDTGLLGRLTVGRDVAEGVEGFPADSGRVLDPRLVRSRVTTRRAFLDQNRCAGLLGTCGDLIQFVLVFGLNAEMAEPRRTVAARRDGEVHARIVEHPFRVVRFALGRLRAEQRRIEADRFIEIGNADVDMETFHFRYSCMI